MEKPPRDVEVVVCLIILGQNQHVHAHTVQEKLDEKRVCLDICSSFRQFFTKNYLHDFKTNMMLLKRDYNAITTYSKRKDWWKGFHVWLLESGIANLISVLHIKADGFTIN